MKRSFLIMLLGAIIALTVSACKESPTVDPGTIYTGTPSDPGTTEVTASLASPLDTATDVDIRSNIVISFSDDIDGATFPGNITITELPATNITYATTVTGNVAELDPDTDFTEGATIQVDLTTSIQDTDGDPLDQAYSWQFLVEADDDPTDTNPPEAISGTFSPYDAADPGAGNGTVSINTSSVQVTFSIAMDPATVTTTADGTGGSFNVSSAVGGACSINQNGNTFELDFGGTSLDYDTLYTVTLTGAIQDLANGIALSGAPITWVFRTEPDPGADPPLAINSYHVSSITDTTARVHWVTSIPVVDTSSSVDYGTDTGYGSNESDESGQADDGSYYSSHYIDLTGLAPGTKYYYRINSGAATATGNFLTKSGGTPAANPGAALRDAGGDNSLLDAVQNTDNTGNWNGSSYVTFSNSTATDGYGFYFATDASTPWTADGEVLDSNARTNIRAFSDDQGYLIVTMEGGGTIYAKRIYDNATTFTFDANWAANAGATGINVGTGTNPSAVKVWGIRQSPPAPRVTDRAVSTGTATMNIPANPFYDFDVDIQTGIVAGDVVIDNGYNGTTIGAVSTNFRHVIGQTAAQVNATETYYIGDNSSSVGATGTDHLLNDTTGPTSTSHTNTGLFAYTEHNFNDTITISANDVIENTSAGNWGLVTGADTVYTLGVASVASGTSDNYAAGELNDTATPLPAATFITNGVTSYSLVEETTTTGIYTHVTNLGVLSETRLNLNADIFSAANETYEIFNGQYCALHYGNYDPYSEIPLQPNNLVAAGNAFTIYSLLATGTADAPPGTPLFADGADFTGDGVLLNDVVLNTTTYMTAGNPNYSQVSDPFAASARALDLFTAGQVGDGDTYRILRYSNPAFAADMLHTGIADNLTVGELEDSTTDFTATGIAHGDIVYNVTDDVYATVEYVSGLNNIVLSQHIFDNGNEEYIIFDSQPRMLIAYETAANDIEGRLIGLEDGAPFSPSFNICSHADNESNVMTASDDSGNAYVVFQNDTNGRIYAKSLDAEGNFIVSSAAVRGNAVDNNAAPPYTLTRVKSFNGYVYILYTNGTNSYLTRLDSDLNDNTGAEWTVTFTSTKVSFDIDSAGNPVVISVDASNDVWAQKITATTGAIAWSTTLDTGTIAGATTVLDPEVIHDGNDGWVLAWADDRYYTELGFVIFSQYLNSAGTEQWDADAAGTDYTGIMKAVPNTLDQADIDLALLSYDDGGAPERGVIYVWYDYRNARSDIFYLNEALP